MRDDAWVSDVDAGVDAIVAGFEAKLRDRLARFRNRRVSEQLRAEIVAEVDALVCDELELMAAEIAEREKGPHV